MNKISWGFLPGIIISGAGALGVFGPVKPEFSFYGFNWILGLTALILTILMFVIPNDN